MTILCHKTKMFPLIIAGMLQLWDGPLECFSFCVQVERKQNFSRRLILGLIFLICLFVYLVWGVILVYYSDRAASQITAIVSGRVIFRTAPHSVQAQREPFLCCSALMLGQSVQPGASLSPFQCQLCPPGSGHKSSRGAASCSCLGVTVPLGFQPGAKCGSSCL